MSRATSSAPTTSATPAGKPGAGYEVSRAHGVCAVTGKTVAPGEKLMAALRETSIGFERVDISMEAWADFDRANVLAFWQTRVPIKEEKPKKLFVDDAVLCELFERLADTTESAKQNFRFVLGLILMRKRMLVYETTRLEEENHEIWVVRFKGKEAKLDLYNPRLDEQQVMEVSQQLSEILNEEI